MKICIKGRPIWRLYTLRKLYAALPNWGEKQPTKSQTLSDFPKEDTTGIPGYQVAPADALAAQDTQLLHNG
jgi:hypothetical protein